MPPATPAIREASRADTARHRARFSAAEQWVARHLGRTDHELRVAEITATVLDLTARLHRYTAADARLLQLAALVHDVGRCVDDAEHPVHGAAMVLSDTSLPLAAAERRALAYLTLYHRGTVPAAGYDDVLHAEDDHARLLGLLGLLRCADGLDSRSLESPRIVLALVAGPAPAGPTLRVSCYLKTDSEKVRRVYQRRKKFRLLEETLGCRVEVTVAQAQGLRMVA